MARGTRSKRQFTSHQREAIYRLVIADGMSAPAAREVLMTYGLPPVGPFTASIDSVRRIARQMANARRAVDTPIRETDPQRQAADLFRAGLRLAEGELERMRAEQERGRRIDPKAFRAWILALRELRRDAATIPKRPPKASEAGPDTEAPAEPKSLAERLRSAEEDPPERSPTDTLRADPEPLEATLPVRETSEAKQASSGASEADGVDEGTTKCRPFDAIDAASHAIETMPTKA